MIVLALDPHRGVGDLGSWLRDVVESTRDLVYGYKVGLPLLLAGGPAAYRAVREYARDNLLIADLKLSDIGDIMSLSIDYLSDLGVDAVIAHSFVGYRDALDKLSTKCLEKGLKLILLVSMSHRGSEEYIDRHLGEFIGLVEKTGAWGVVAPATRPNVIRFVRERLGQKIKIFSPGVGAQGAGPGSAICSGADYEIVGRYVVGSGSPRERLLEFIELQREAVERCMK